jgi:hypothetical protein
MDFSLYHTRTYWEVTKHMGFVVPTFSDGSEYKWAGGAYILEHVLVAIHRSGGLGVQKYPTVWVDGADLSLGNDDSMLDKHGALVDGGSKR